MDKLGAWKAILSNAAAMAGRNYSPRAPHLYNPLEYARQPAQAYWRLLGQGPKKALFLGMNPGPWGMGQTGVPFGDPHLVREWMGIQGEVLQPRSPLEKRPVIGLGSPRSEVSGNRLWGLMSRLFPRAEDFFSRFMVWNYCPLIFYDEKTRNITPDNFHPREVIAVGGYAEKTALRVAGKRNIPVRRVLHPSPANPAANRGWEEAVLQTLGEAFFLP
jgi:single-strand selective monofunctional uracil DNA glycosylase